MNPQMVQVIVQITNEALLLVCVLCAPPILLSMVVGVSVSLFQAVTQIQEQTLSFVPKLVMVFGSLAVLGGWIGSTLLSYAQKCLEVFPMVVGG